MGEDLKDEREKGHVEYKDHIQHKMLIINFSMLSTMLKHGGGITTLHYEHRKDDNLPLTLSLFISF
jgi:hypothetical protein